MATATMRGGLLKASIRIDCPCCWQCYNAMAEFLWQAMMSSSTSSAAFASVLGFINTDRNEIMYNHIENSAREGIELSGEGFNFGSGTTAAENTIAHNVLLNNSHLDQVGDITLFRGAHRNVIRDNHIVGSDDGIGYGVWLLKNNNENQIRDNVVVGTFNGLYVTGGAKENIIEGNEFRDSVWDGINVNETPAFCPADLCLGEISENVISDNTVIGSGRHGIHFANPNEIGAVSNNRLERNLVRASGSNGFLIRNSGTERVFANIFEDNTAQQNSGDGFVLDGGSDQNTFKGNEAAENGGHGFVVTEGSDLNTFENNEAEENGGHGFVVTEDSDLNTFENNEAEENGGYGFLVDAILFNVFEDNECEDNLLGGSNQDAACGDDDADDED